MIKKQRVFWGVLFLFLAPFAVHGEARDSLFASLFIQESENQAEALSLTARVINISSHPIENLNIAVFLRTSKEEPVVSLANLSIHSVAAHHGVMTLDGITLDTKTLPERDLEFVEEVRQGEEILAVNKILYKGVDENQPLVDTTSPATQFSVMGGTLIVTGQGQLFVSNQRRQKTLVQFTVKDVPSGKEPVSGPAQLEYWFDYDEHEIIPIPTRDREYVYRMYFPDDLQGGSHDLRFRSMDREGNIEKNKKFSFTLNLEKPSMIFSATNGEIAQFSDSALAIAPHTQLLLTPIGKPLGIQHSFLWLDDNYLGYKEGRERWAMGKDWQAGSIHSIRYRLVNDLNQVSDRIQVIKVLENPRPWTPRPVETSLRSQR